MPGKVHPDDEDTDRVPAKRNDLCINCGNTWTYHDGWSCVIYSCPGFKSPFKSMLEKHERYLTADMEPQDPLRSVFAPKVHQSNQPLSKLGLWFRDSGLTVNDCPCGIKRSVCDFHRR